MIESTAEIRNVLGPFTGIDQVNGVTCDGDNVWVASGDALNAVDAATGQPKRSIDVAAHAGTAFDGVHLYQLDDDRIRKVDPITGRVVSTITVPAGGSGLAWAEGTLWMGQYEDRLIRRIDPESGATISTVTSDRFVTGVTWVEGELWHAGSLDDSCALNHVDPATGDVLETIVMPDGVWVSGIESAGGNQFFCGHGDAGTVSVVGRAGGP